MLVVPNHWTLADPILPGYNHPFNRIAWMLMDGQSQIEEMTGEQQQIIYDIMDELGNLENSHIIEHSIVRTKRRAKILNAKPLKVNDERIKSAYLVAMTNRQMSADEMPYDTFKMLYDDIINIIEKE